MNNFEFLSYEPVNGEKFLGIATVRAWGKIILRYKIVPTKDGKGIFPASSSIKNGEKYENSFMIDSNYENQAIIALIKDKVCDCIAGKPIAQSEAIKRPSDTPSDDDCPF